MGVQVHHRNVASLVPYTTVKHKKSNTSYNKIKCGRRYLVCFVFLLMSHFFIFTLKYHKWRGAVLNVFLHGAACSPHACYKECVCAWMFALVVFVLSFVVLVICPGWARPLVQSALEKGSASLMQQV